MMQFAVPNFTKVELDSTFLFILFCHTTITYILLQLLHAQLQERSHRVSTFTGPYSIAGPGLTTTPLN